MKKYIFFLIVILTGISMFAEQGNTTALPNPAPSVLADDLNDSGIFSHDNQVINFELFDFGEFILQPLPFGGIFGFYFESEPDTLIPIFDFTDASAFDPPQAALIDFNEKLVVDIDLGIIQSNFGAVEAAGDIGFFLQPDVALPIILFTDPARNPGHTDVAATYPLIDDVPFLGYDLDYVIGFWSEDDIVDPVTGDIISHFSPIAFEATGGITPAPVPEPATFLLLGTGLLGLAGGLRRKLKK
jgi:hypothetical protein